MLARFLFFFFVYSIHVTLASLSFFLSFLVFFFVYIYISFSSFASPPPTAPRVFIFNEEVKFSSKMKHFLFFFVLLYFTHLITSGLKRKSQGDCVVVIFKLIDVIQR
mgnify:CR=1 FL=1